MNVETLKQKVLAGGFVSPDEAHWLAFQAEKEALYEAAHELTRHFLGAKFDLCSIINAKSGNCGEDCKWCAQSLHYHTAAEIYPLLPAERCVEEAVYNSRKGVRRFSLVTSGKRLSPVDIEKIAATVRRIRQSCPVRCCASMGPLLCLDGTAETRGFAASF